MSESLIQQDQVENVPLILSLGLFVNFHNWDLMMKIRVFNEDNLKVLRSYNQSSFFLFLGAIPRYNLFFMLLFFLFFIDIVIYDWPPEM